MPSRWPLPTGTKPSSAPHAEREPLVDPGAPQRVGRRRRPSSAARPCAAAAAVDRAAEAVEDAAEELLADGELERARRSRRRALPGPIPAIEPNGISSVRRRGSPRPRRERACALRPRSIEQQLADVGPKPARLDHESDQALARGRCGDSRSALCEHADVLVERDGGSFRAGSASARRSSCRRVRAGLRDLASISPSRVRTTQPPRPTRRSAATDDRPRRRRRGGRAGQLRPDELDVVRVDVEHELVRRPTSAGAAPRRRPRGRARARRRARSPRIRSAIAIASSTARARDAASSSRARAE